MKDRRDKENSKSATPPKCSYGGDGYFHDDCGGVWKYKKTAPFSSGGPRPPPPPPPEGTPGTAFAGMLWGLFVGLVGLCSLVVFAANIFMDLPDKILKWFYLAAACTIAFFAILGMSYNAENVCASRCFSYREAEFKDRPKDEQTDDRKTRDKEGCRESYQQRGLRKRIIPLLLSSFHVTLYTVSFGMALMAKKPEVGPSPMGMGYPQPAGGYGPPQPREGSAMMPVNPGTEPEPRPSAVQSAQ